MKHEEHRADVDSASYRWGNEQFVLRTLQPRTVLALSGKGKKTSPAVIAPQWAMLFNAAANLAAVLKQEDYPALPALHTAHIVEIIAGGSGREGCWELAAVLPPAPAIEDWTEAIIRDDLARELRHFSGLAVRREPEQLVAETQCDSSEPFNLEELERMERFCSMNIFAACGPASWIADLDAHTGSFGLSILRLPVRKKLGSATVC